ncbi:MAG TPA: MarR family transcriptional regulator [Luteimonas sp.]|nr:MarR family transcriptional regulator [Luteimonas sp.]
MDADSQRRQAAAGLESLASLVRAQSWRSDGTPSLPPSQAAVLRMLADADEGLRAGRIAERLGVSAASVSDSLAALESKRWIKRGADPRDLRATLVRLTAQGKRTAQKLRDPLQGIGSLVGALDERDLGAFLRVSQLLVAQAQRQGLATGMRTCLGCRFFRPYSTGRDDKPHFCGFIEQPFGDAELRMDCAEQEPAEETIAAASAARFRRTLPP